MFIYFRDTNAGGLSEMEDALVRCLPGKLRCSGSGSGNEGSNLDFDILDGAVSPEELLRAVIPILKEFEVDQLACIDIDGISHSLGG